MPRDKTGKNRKYGHHKDKQTTGQLSEEDILKMLSKKPKASESDDEENEEENQENSDNEEEGFF